MSLQTCPPDRMEPSWLLPLRPVGAGTPLVESTTSLLMRLAEAHHLTPADLVTTGLAPYLEERWGAPGPHPAFGGSVLRGAGGLDPVP